MSVHTLFKSDKISFETKENDYCCVNASLPINRGDLLLVEHCYSAESFNKLASVIKTTLIIIVVLIRFIEYNGSCNYVSHNYDTICNHIEFYI
jgi:hypothetical protein